MGWDYYRNLEEIDFLKNLDLPVMFSKWVFFYIPVSQDLYFVGWKGDSPAPEVLQAFSAKVEEIKEMSNSSGPVMHFLTLVERWLLFPFTCFGDRAFQNVMVPYSKVRERLYRMIIGRG